MRAAAGRLLLAWGLATQGLLADDWPQHRRDASRAAASAETLPLPLTVAWTRTLGASQGGFCSPVAADGRVFVGVGKTLYALEAATGDILWEVDLGGGVDATPAVWNGAVYAVTRAGSLVRLSARTGRVMRRSSADATILSSPLVTESGRAVIGVGLPRNQIRGYSLSRPEKRIWSIDLSRPCYGSAAGAQGRVVIGANNATFYALDEETGDAAWHYGVSSGEVDVVSVCVAGGTAYLATSGLATVHAADLSTGEILWTRQPGGVSGGVKTGSFAATADRLVLLRLEGSGPSAKSTLSVLDRGSGNDLWRWQQISGAPVPGFYSSPAVAADKIFACIDKTLKVFPLTGTAPEESHELGATVHSSPTPANGRVHVNADGTLYTFQSGNYAPDAPVSGFSPADGEQVAGGSVTLSWNPAYDPNHGADGLRYIVRGDDDGEVAEDWDWEIVTAQGQVSTAVPATDLRPDTTIHWRVRAQDADGALSTWSRIRSFGYAQAAGEPETAPVGFAATPNDRSVTLTWQPPPAGVPPHYDLAVMTAGDDGVDIPYWIIDGAETSLTIHGLANGVEHTFVLVARHAGTHSPGVFVTVAPGPRVRLRGADGTETTYATLQDAAAAARSGDTILAGAGVFTGETVELPAGVSLEGESPSATIVAAANPRAPAVRVQGGRALSEFQGASENKLPVVRNLTVRGASEGILVEDRAAVLILNVIATQNGVGVAVRDGARAVVRTSTLAQNTKDGLHIPASNRVDVRGNVFSGNPGAAVRRVGGSKKKTPPTTYCVFHANGATHADGAASGVGDTVASGPLFRDALFHERQGSAAVDGGKPGDDWTLEPLPNGKRINAGAYGNTPEAATSGPATAASGDGAPEEDDVAEPGESTAAGGCFLSR